MVAVWRSEGVFLILPMVAAAVGMRERAVRDVYEGYRGLYVQVFNQSGLSCVLPNCREWRVWWRRVASSVSTEGVSKSARK